MQGIIKDYILENLGEDNKTYSFILNVEKVYGSVKNFVSNKIGQIKLHIDQKLDKIPIEPDNGILKLELDKKWDFFPDPAGKKKSFFAGRSEDVDKLVNWLFYSNGGSVLIRGFRGIGKTAFVYHSISKISQYGKKVLFFPVNFSENFDKNDENRDLP
ncbi:MAG: hypothetical protein U0946_04970, partial [Patescibacteria group bacterium]|nr:hypothetical protein [Patescibacteria group bacterium]